jgi:hypothetical protein
MASIRVLVATGELPSIQVYEGQCDRRFERALCHGTNTKFRVICELFSRDAPTDSGTGEHYVYGMVGSLYGGAHETILAVARHQGIDVLDLTRTAPKVLESLPIRDIVDFILKTPPRCMIIVSLESDRMVKVMKRLSKKQMDLRFRRVVFCLTASLDRLPDGAQSTLFPGTTDDRLQMLMYKLASSFTADIELLRPIATVMVDYAVFEHRIWRNVNTTGTLAEFLSTLTFQVHRRSTIMDVESTLDTFPSFESAWRRSFAGDLQQQLTPTPDTTCRALHRVLPAGVSPRDAIKCIQTAIPHDLTDPYALTVASEAADDRCGSIYITQPTHHTVVNLQCTIDPGILSEVCRELRTGHRQIVQELNTMRDGIEVLKALIVGDKRPRDVLSSRQCSKRTCNKIVEDRFGNGELKRQCRTCISICKRTKKSRTQTTSPTCG